MSAPLKNHNQGNQRTVLE